MRAIPLWFIVAVTASVVGSMLFLSHVTAVKPASPAETIKLPGPAHDSSTSVEHALSHRRSVREYGNGPLNLSEVSQLLWAAQGITSPEGMRTAPSAGALYPLEVYVVAGKVDGLRSGVYKYIPARHMLELVSGGDKRAELSSAALGQPGIKNAAIDVVIAGVYERATGKYNSPDDDERTGSRYPRGVRYVFMEAGHAAQNICLQSESLGLDTVTIGAFSDGAVKDVVRLRDEERPLYILPVGRA